MIPGRDVIIVAWVDPDGDIQPTGRRVLHDGQWIQQFKPGPRAYAVVWSRDAVDMQRAKEYAEKQRCTVLVLADTDDVLDRARAAVMQNPGTWRDNLALGVMPAEWMQPNPNVRLGDAS